MSRGRSPFAGDPGGIIDPTSGRIIRGTEKWNIYCPLGCPHPWEWRPLFPWQPGFDPKDRHWQDRGWRFVQFVETFCVHTKDPWRGMPFYLMPFQLAIGLIIFGTLDDEGYRIFRTAFIEWARKSGKSELAAAIVCYFLFSKDGGVYGGEIYGAAKDQDQANLIFAVVADMVELSPFLKLKAKVTRSTHRILNRKTGTFYYAIPADEAGAHGFNATVVIGDEIHKWPDRELWDTLTTSHGTRMEPFDLAITTTGTDDPNTLDSWMAAYSRKVADGIIADRTWFSDIRQVPLRIGEGDDAVHIDPLDERYWYLANPGLGTREQIAAGLAFRDIEEMRTKALQAQDSPALMLTFRRLYLNQRLGSHAGLIPMADWDACPEPRSIEDLMTTPACYGGLDLASTTDIAAIALWFERDDDSGVLDLVSTFFIPEDSIDEASHRDGVPYRAWVDDQWIFATPGNQIDYAFIGQKWDELNRAFDVLDVGFDQWGAVQMTQELAERGLSVTPIPQTITRLSAPTKDLLRRVRQHRIAHGDNPVLRWMAQNTVGRVDANENVRPDKSKSTGRIDGIVAAIMGLDGLNRDTVGPSVYEEHGVDAV